MWTELYSTMLLKAYPDGTHCSSIQKYCKLKLDIPAGSVLSDKLKGIGTPHLIVFHSMQEDNKVYSTNLTDGTATVVGQPTHVHHYSAIQGFDLLCFHVQYNIWLKNVFLY